MSYQVQHRTEDGSWVKMGPVWGKYQKAHEFLRAQLLAYPREKSLDYRIRFIREQCSVVQPERSMDYGKDTG